MNRTTRLAAVALLIAAPMQACSRGVSANTPSPSAPAQAQERPGGGGGSSNDGPRPYSEVITDQAVTQAGMFDVHRVGDDLFFEIPPSEFGREMLLLQRPMESTLQDAGGFFGGGARLYVQWERDGNHVVLREKEYDLTADESDPIWRQVSGFRKGPVLQRFEVEAFAADSSAVIDVSELFISNIPEFAPIDGLNSGRSWVEQTWAFDDAINVQVTQSGQARPAGGQGGGPGGGAQASPRSQTMRLFFSMARLPDDPMMPRWHDARVGFNSSRSWDFSRPNNRLEQVRFIHRFRLEKQNPGSEVSDPVEPIVYWIDPATPDWLKPWIVSGVDAWQGAFEKAGYSNAIFGRIAPTPEEDPTFSLFDARNSVIYWRPSTVANATGGQVVDPRSGQILKGEVNMYHNIMDLQKHWYFIQVGPLDERAQTLPLPDSLMGKLVEYVVAHEIGHSIGFPHNMKSSSQYPVDSIRSASFLERMGGSHVATLMDYSRFNYVAQPEDNIPLDYLIPKVGPYDDFAVNWGYGEILGAATPDDELPTLDEWARQQDDFPWLRFSTADADGSDPGNLTEAVGDADAVRSTTLGMRNLDRVMDMLIDVTEQPGRDYTELEDMYGQAVGQWGRYMGHVVAIIGSAETQERYGTGPRFEPTSRERQAEAMAYLSTAGFHVPDMFLDEAVLRRIEPSGVVSRFRTQQSRLVNNLLSQARLERLVEFEALDGANYSITDFMADLRDGVWTELADDGAVRVNAYRRNLQRGYIDAADSRLNPTQEELERNFNPAAEPWTSDVRAVLRSELRSLSDLVMSALDRVGDEITRVHLQDVSMEIDRILAASR